MTSLLFLKHRVDFQVDPLAAIVMMEFPHFSLYIASTETAPNEYRELTETYLDNNHFAGPIPASFGLLSNLQVLALNGNTFSGMLPDLGGMKSLVSIMLQNNLFSGSIPTSIGSLVNLKVLNLESNTGLTGKLPDSLGSLKSLQYLHLSNCNFTGILPPSMGNLANLTDFPTPRVSVASSSSPYDFSAVASPGLIFGTAAAGVIIALMAVCGVLFVRSVGRDRTLPSDPPFIEEPPRDYKAPIFTDAHSTKLEYGQPSNSTSSYLLPDKDYQQRDSQDYYGVQPYNPRMYSSASTVQPYRYFDAGHSSL
eukprot:jgi/Hompol1/5130/HPOL_004203-RA